MEIEQKFPISCWDNHQDKTSHLSLKKFGFGFGFGFWMFQYSFVVLRQKKLEGVGLNQLAQPICKKKNMSHDMWHGTCDMWHVIMAGDRWGGGDLSQTFSSIAVTG